MEKRDSIIAQAGTVALEKRGQLDVIVIENAYVRAEILQQGAQLIHYQKVDEEHPVIWHSREIAYEAGTPIRGGIPLIAPWFADHDKNPLPVREHTESAGDAPAHGFLRSALWQLDSIDEESEETTLTFSYTYESANALWDVPFHAVVTYTIGDVLDVRFAITNTGYEDMHIATALHTYFAISDVETIALPSFDGVSYIDSLDGEKKKIWRGNLPLDRERDYIFLAPPTDQQIIDNAWNRRTIIRTHGSGSTVLWNPWIAKSKTLSMFRSEEYKEMVCIETANVAASYRTLPVGTEDMMRVEIHTAQIT